MLLNTLNLHQLALNRAHSSTSHRKYLHNDRLNGRFLECSEAKALLAHIKFHIELAHEDITKDVKRSCWGWDIQAGHPKHTLALTLEGVVLLSERVGVARNHDVEVWRSSVAIESVLLVERSDWAQGFGTDKRRDLLDVSSGDSQQ